jgi:hypothetical protein
MRSPVEAAFRLDYDAQPGLSSQCQLAALRPVPKGPVVKRSLENCHYLRVSPIPPLHTRLKIKFLIGVHTVRF